MKKNLVLAAKIVVSLALLALLFSKTHPRELWQRISDADPRLLVGAAFLYLVMLALSVWRWRMLLEAQGHVAPMAHLSGSYLVATFFNNFLPSTVGGDVIRVRDSSRLTGSTTSAAAIVIIDRIIGFGALYVPALAAYVVAGPEARRLTGARVVLGGLGAFFTALAYVFFRPGTARRLMTLTRLDRIRWAREQFDTVQSAVHVYRQELGTIWKAFAASLALQTIMICYYFAIARALQIDVPFSSCALMVPLCILVQTFFPFSLNGLGIREAVFTQYFVQLRLPNPQASAMAFSFMGAGLIMLLSLSGAIVFMARGSAAPAAAE
jgi:uncharacterized protein (TIRG00374 family)